MKYAASFTIFLSFLVFSYIPNAEASDGTLPDSLTIIHVVNDFYNWYLNAIKKHQYAEFNPQFTSDDKGMTTLSFSPYLENLAKHHFSDELISKEEKSYQNCLANLEDVKFADFQKTAFTDIDEYEEAGCDFGNYYRWIGGMEPVDGIRIKRISFQSENLASVFIGYFKQDAKSGKKTYWGNNTLTLIRKQQNWYIDNIASWREQ